MQCRAVQGNTGQYAANSHANDKTTLNLLMSGSVPLIEPRTCPRKYQLAQHFLLARGLQETRGERTPNKAGTVTQSSAKISVIAGLWTGKKATFAPKENTARKFFRHLHQNSTLQGFGCAAGRITAVKGLCYAAPSFRVLLPSPRRTLCRLEVT